MKIRVADLILVVVNKLLVVNLTGIHALTHSPSLKSLGTPGYLFIFNFSIILKIVGQPEGPGTLFSGQH